MSIPLTPLQLFRQPLFTSSQKHAFCRLADLALVPSAGRDRAARLRRLVASPSWQPLPLIPVLSRAAEPIIHNAALADIDPARLFVSGSFLDVPNQQTLSGFAVDYHRRRRILFDLLQRMESHGIEFLLLIKGASIASRFDSPALRFMLDSDLVLAGDHNTRERTHTALREGGFEPAPANAPGVWYQPSSGASIDLLEPAHQLGRQILNHPQSFPSPDWPDIAAEPRVPDHLVIVALHAARHHGGRLWRDVLDVRALVRDRSSRKDFTDALRIAGRVGLSPAVEALLAFAGEVCSELPRSHPRTRQGRNILALYRETAWLPYPPHALKLLRRVLAEGISPRELVERFGRRQPAHDSGEGWSEPDFGVGRVPARFADRQRFKLKLAAGLLLSGRAPETIRLLRGQTLAQSCAPKLFKPVKSAP